MKIKINKYKDEILVLIITTFMGQIYLTPFSSNFRFSFSVVAFTLLLFWNKKLDIFKMAFVTGIFLFIFRLGVQWLNQPNETILYLIMTHYPVVIFYCFFGYLLKLWDFRLTQDNKLLFIVLLSFTDGFSNILEIMVRNEDISKITGATWIFLVGFFRSCITFAIIEMIKYYRRLLAKEQHEEHYKHLVLFTSNLKSEVFFLQKSMDDVEVLMEKSFKLYESLKGYEDGRLLEYQSMALSIAKDIHEVKKDYYRLADGLQKLIPDTPQNEKMLIGDVFNIIESNFTKSIQSLNKDVFVSFTFNKNIIITNVYEFVSIINNLITNSIEAIEKEKGEIKVDCFTDEKDINLIIKDNGEGISKSNIAIIFEPGFSTKFDRKTGKMNSGLGLSHVSYLVKAKFNGTIEVFSEEGRGTVFNVRIPIDSI